MLNISETELTLTATLAAQSCNSVAENTSDTCGGLKATGKPYALSSTANRFMVTGCHHYGLIEAKVRGGRKVVCCVALCTKKEDLIDDTCSGLGCCEASIPKGLLAFNASMEKIVYNTNFSSGNCSYAFIAKRSSIDFHRATDLQDPDFASKVRSMPAVLDWFIANGTCQEAQKSVTYACQKNTYCVDLKDDLNVHGYRCKCRQGYEGNPYLIPGCTDINECKGPTNPCTESCENTPGNHRCRCPKGYHGDGRKDGSGCVASSMKWAFPFGLGIGLGSILFFLSGYWILTEASRRKKQQQKARNFERNGGLLLKQQLSSQDGMIEKTRIFTADELEKATDNYNEDRVLGEGGQGTVYKGMLSDGNLVAIKKAKIGTDSHLSHFINEVVILSQINHRNIVKLLGCCLETQVPLLVYKFIPNGTLSKYIHDDTGENILITWEMRLQIAIDVAGALTYLHSASSKFVFHRDIKTSNILLDAKYRAKLSDFGSSRSIAIDQTHLTTLVQGTFGYIDPEYFQSNHFTEKGDVYGFGVVLVELLTGKRAVLPAESHDRRSLVSWFLSSMENSDLSDILAARVASEGRPEIILAVANLAKRCLNIDGTLRPTMREVSLELEMMSQIHYLAVSVEENLSEVTANAFTETGNSLDHSLLLPCMSFLEEDHSFPSRRVCSF